jgi:hypothetical protein
MGRLNALLRYVEAETGWNPLKEKFVKDMLEIRAKLAHK